MKHPTLRWTVALTLCTLGLLVLVGLTFGSAVIRERALNSCTLTPPKEIDPYTADRTGTVGVDPKGLFGYECVYTHDDGTVIHRPPP